MKAVGAFDREGATSKCVYTQTLHCLFPGRDVKELDGGDGNGASASAAWLAVGFAALIL